MTLVEPIGYTVGTVLVAKCGCRHPGGPGHPRFKIEHLRKDPAGRSVLLRNLATGRKHRTSWGRLTTGYLMEVSSGTGVPLDH